MRIPNIKYAHGRFKGAPWYKSLQSSKIFIGGAGGIGSHLCFQLARTGAHITIVDHDEVGIENLAGQLYGESQIGYPKVQAIKEVCKNLCDKPSIFAINQEVTAESITTVNLDQADVVCVGFDNLEARRMVYDYWRASGKDSSLFVDGRLGFESGQVFIVEKTADPSVHLAYQDTYFSLEERVELPCSAKATTHCGSLIASMMVMNITNWFSNQDKPVFRREVKNIEFHLPITLFLTTEFVVENKQVYSEEHDYSILTS